MDTQEVNFQLVRILNEWDPFGCGIGEYDPEIADVVYVVHKTDDAHHLAVNIQSIYEHSFEELLPYKGCLEIAKSLLMIKSQGSCEI